MDWELRFEGPGPKTRVEVACGKSNGLLRDLRARPGSFFLVLDEGFQKGQGGWLDSLCQEAKGVCLLPGGEAEKTPETLIRLCSRMVRAGLGREDLVVVMGGGAILDLGGLAASLVFRGIPLIQVPTTLLSAVDACLGGKCAVDLPEGRNLIGSFHFAERILVDPLHLKSLPLAEFANGMGEVAKYGLGFSRELMEWLLERSPLGPGSPPDQLEELVLRCLKLKAEIVLQDPWEREGLRRTLNLGHSLAHALEAAAGNGELSHGRAVGIGLRAELRAGRLSSEERREGELFLDHLGQASSLTQLFRRPPSARELLDFFLRDKKAEGEWIHEPKLERLGVCCVEKVKALPWMEALLSTLR